MTKPTGLKRRRLLAGLTLQEVADALRKAGLKPANVRAVWDWEHGHFDVPKHIAAELRKILK